MYLTKKKKLGQSEQLDRICRSCGDVWTDTARWFWRTVNRQGVWLSKYSMMRWMCTRTINGRPNPMAAKPSRLRIAQNTAQNVVKEFYQALDAWRERRGENGARPPRKPKRYYKANWNYTQIRLSDGVLRLSTGRSNDPVLVDWPHPEPKRVEIGWDGEQYELRAQYKAEPVSEPTGEKVAGIDLGEIHLAVAYDGEETIIINGRHLRSLRQYQNKTKAKLSALIDRKKRGSRRWKRLVTSKNQQLAALRNQIRDVLHKLSTRLVDTLHERGVSTLVIGDVRDIRDGLDYGSKANQSLHQWCSGAFRRMIEYKAWMRGMETRLVDEAYTSQTCPSCGNRKKPRGRNYDCPECGFAYHRDGVGAMNIRGKYLGETRVVGVRATPAPVGVRYRPHMECSSLSEDQTARAAPT